LSPDSLIENLSVAEKTNGGNCEALVNDSRNSSLWDEPTYSSGQDHEVDIFFSPLGRQTQTAVASTIIFISHKLKEVKVLC